MINLNYKTAFKINARMFALKPPMIAVCPAAYKANQTSKNTKTRL